MQSIFRLFLCFALFSSYFCGPSKKFGKTRRGSETSLLEVTDEEVFRQMNLNKKSITKVQNLEKLTITHLHALMDCDFDFVGLLRKVEFEVYKEQSNENRSSARLFLDSVDMKNPSFFTLTEPGRQRKAWKHKVWRCDELSFKRNKFLLLLKKIVFERELLLQTGEPWQMDPIYRTILSKFQFHNFFLHTSAQMSSKKFTENFLPSVVVYSKPEQMFMQCSHKDICLYQDMFTNEIDASLAYQLIQNLLKYKGYEIVDLSKKLLEKRPKDYEKFKLFSTQDLIGRFSDCSKLIAKMTLPNNTNKIELDPQCKSAFEAFKQKVGELWLFYTEGDIHQFAKLFKVNMHLSPILQGILLKLESDFGLNEPKNLKLGGILYPQQFQKTIEELKKFDPIGEDFVNEDGYPVLELSALMKKK